MSNTAELIAAGMHPAEATTIDRNDAIVLIREALKRRSGKTWSVTGGSGTAWGWIRIMSPPMRRVSSDGTPQPGRNWYMTAEDCAELGELLGLGEPVHIQGESIPAASDYRRAYIARARGLEVIGDAQPYWD